MGPVGHLADIVGRLPYADLPKAPPARTVVELWDKPDAVGHLPDPRKERTHPDEKARSNTQGRMGYRDFVHANRPRRDPGECRDTHDDGKPDARFGQRGGADPV